MDGAESERTNQFRRPAVRRVIPDRVAERAATRCEVQESGCWLSTYSVGSHGYAQVGWADNNGTTIVTAHRAAWVHNAGVQIPEGMTVDHTCKNRTCVNPAHLRLLTNFENARRTSGRDWKLGECVNGHSNDMLERSGRRWQCGPCTREHKRRYLRKQRAQAAPE